MEEREQIRNLYLLWLEALFSAAKPRGLWLRIQAELDRRSPADPGAPESKALPLGGSAGKENLP
ncbi:MAG: hypothetical protein IKS05_07625 [Oscillospiraceae bacterium]|nr:hypothetical protein [Oscillospiraceae bacterium]